MAIDINSGQSSVVIIFLFCIKGKSIIFCVLFSEFCQDGLPRLGRICRTPRQNPEIRPQKIMLSLEN